MAIDARKLWPLALGVAAWLAACTQGGQRAPVPPPPGNMVADLDGLLVFANPAECEPGEPLKQLYDTMAAYDARHQPHARQPAVPDRFAGAVGEASMTLRAADHAIVTVPVRGRWMGLPVRAIEGLYGIESDAFGMAIVFAAPLSRTRAVLQSHGFHPRPAEALASHPPGHAPFGRVGMTGNEQESRLFCDWGP